MSDFLAVEFATCKYFVVIMAMNEMGVSLTCVNRPRGVYMPVAVR